MAKKMSESWVKGYAIGKRIKYSPYPVVFEHDPDIDKEEFIKGLRFGGYHGEVNFNGI